MTYAKSKCVFIDFLIHGRREKKKREIDIQPKKRNALIITCLRVLSPSSLVLLLALVVGREGKKIKFSMNIFFLFLFSHS